MILRWFESLALAALFATGAAGAGHGSPPPPAGWASVPSRAAALSGTSRLSYIFAWSQRLSVNADSVPVFLRQVTFRHGRARNMLYVLAGNNATDCDPNPRNFVKASTLYGFDAGTGKVLWQQSSTGASRCTTSAPAVYRNWVYAPGLDGKVHKYDAATGKEYRRNGWPIRYTLNPFREKASAPLQISNPYLYVTTSGFAGDLGHYEGHLVTINLNTAHVNVWNGLCSDIHVLLSPNPRSRSYCRESGGALFGRGEAAIDPVNHDVYIVSGNGLWDGKTNWSDSVLKLSSDGSRLLDSFTPTNQAYLQATDNDLGSTGPAILPAVEVKGKTYHLLMQGGKGSAGFTKSPKVVYLLNRDQLGGRSGPGSLGGSLQTVVAPGKQHILSAPAVWKDPHGAVLAIYANSNDIEAYQVVASGALPHVKVKWDIHIASRTKRAHAGIFTPYPNFTTPVIAADRLYVAHDGAVQVYNPENGRVLWSSTSLGQSGTISSNLHWEYPCVANGMIFMTDESSHVYAYRLVRP